MEELYLFLDGKGMQPDIKYRFNHWFLVAEIAGVSVSGDREEVIAMLAEYYEDRKGKNVVVTIGDGERITLKGKEIALKSLFLY